MQEKITHAGLKPATVPRTNRADVTENLNELLVMAFTGRARIRCQDPVVLDNASEPQPDIALVRLPKRVLPCSGRSRAISF